MREIKFRAKAKFDDKWVYGFYVERDGYTKGMIYERNGMGHDVHPETRGQFTGLLDKSSKETYEGDIIQWWFEGKEYDRGASDRKIKFYTIGFHQGSFVLYRGKDGGRTGHMLGNIDMRYSEFEVVGDIYKNKDLLK